MNYVNILLNKAVFERAYNRPSLNMLAHVCFAKKYWLFIIKVRLLFQKTYSKYTHHYLLKYYIPNLRPISHRLTFSFFKCHWHLRKNINQRKTYAWYTWRKSSNYKLQSTAARLSFLTELFSVQLLNLFF